MKHEVRFFHCNEYEEVIEIESYLEENGAIVSIKQSEVGQYQPFTTLRQQLEADGWEIELVGVIPVGSNHISAPSYCARLVRA
jgi:hypothetical protein